MGGMVDAVFGAVTNIIGGVFGGGNEQPAAPAPQAPVAPPKAPEKQADKTAQVAAMKAQKRAAMVGAQQAGANNTMLTGPTGVEDSALTLGKNTLLGG